MTRKEANEKYHARNLQMKKMHDEGMTLEAIGKDYGVTRERVRQCIAKVERQLSCTIVDRIMLTIEKYFNISELTHMEKYRLQHEIINIVQRYKEDYYL